MNTIATDVQAVLDHLVDSGTERGVQAAVYRHGELLVDAVAGIADPATGRPMMPDTPVFATSTGKGVAATVVHVLAERGALDYATPIAALWPEFAAHGKGTATVAHALTHSVGVPGLPADLQPDAFLDWDAMCALVADAVPWWEPGTTTGYHAQTFGWIVGEIVRRATGKPISQVLLEEVAAPLGVGAELFFGVPDAAIVRVGTLEDEPVPSGANAGADFLEEEPDDSHGGWVWAPPACMPTSAYGNRVDLLRTDIPAGATMTARAVARMYAALMHDVDGVRLIPDDRLRTATASAVRGTDAIFGMPVDRSLGYALGFDGPFDAPTTFGMAGSGGCAAYADTATGIAVAVTKNVSSFGNYATFNAVAGVVAKAVGK